MQSQSYLERATAVARESQIAVQILLSRANDDIEVIPLAPHSASGFITEEEFNARQLRSVGVIGLCNLRPLSTFKELLDPLVVQAINAAFLEYVRSLLGETCARQVSAAEVAELERLYLLPDLRN